MLYLRPLRRLVLALLLALVLPSAAAAQPGKYEFLYTFGDSLADNGNLFLGTKQLGFDPALPPSETPHRTYFNGRFSNGPVAFEYLWQLLSGNAPGTPRGLRPFLASPVVDGAGGVNFAFGGSGTGVVDHTPGGDLVPGLQGQVELFRIALRGRKPSKRSLFAIVTGANEYLRPVPNAPADVVANIVTSVRTLYELGARNVMVMTLPDLGLIPASVGAGTGPVLTMLTGIHNDLLRDASAQLSAELPMLNLILIELEAAVGAVMAQMAQVAPVETDVPALEAMGLYPGASACLYIDPTTCVDVPTFDRLPGTGFDAKHFLFWDIVHPTTEAHRLLAHYLYDSLK